MAHEATIRDQGSGFVTKRNRPRLRGSGGRQTHRSGTPSYRFRSSLPMEPSLVAEALAAHPDGGRVTAAAVVGCICLDHVACTECDRILGIPFLAIDERPPSPRRASTPGSASGSGSPPVPMARIGVGLRLGIGPRTGGDGAGAEQFDASISGMAEQLGLAPAVGDRAEEVFRKMEEARPRGRGRAARAAAGARAGPAGT